MASLRPLIPLAVLLNTPLAAQEVQADREENAEITTTGERTPLFKDPPERPPMPTGALPGPPTGFPGFKPVFDETWATVGIGAGLVPSYSGSDDYRIGHATGITFFGRSSPSSQKLEKMGCLQTSSPLYFNVHGPPCLIFLFR